MKNLTLKLISLGELNCRFMWQNRWLNYEAALLKIINDVHPISNVVQSQIVLSGAMKFTFGVSLTLIAIVSTGANSFIHTCSVGICLCTPCYWRKQTYVEHH